MNARAPRHLLIFGATGGTGRELVRQALERGFEVTAFARQPAKLVAADAPLRVLEGDVRDAAAVAAAVAGQDAVISALGVGRPLHHDPGVVEGVRHIVGAMEASGVRRLIYQSFIGVAESRAAVGFVLRFVAPIALRQEIADHEAKEALVRASALDWTIVRPPKLTDGPRTGRLRHGVEITTSKPLPTLSRADVAEFILDEVADPRYVRRAPRLLPP